MRTAQCEIWLVIEAAGGWRWEEHAVGAIIPKLVNVLYRSSCWRRKRLRMGAIGARKEAAWGHCRRRLRGRGGEGGGRPWLLEGSLLGWLPNNYKPYSS